jgi:glycine dehydrogenase
MNVFNRYDQFVDRHLGPNQAEKEAMLKAIGVDSIEDLIDQTLPASIRIAEDIDVGEAVSEFRYFQELQKKADKNKQYRDFIGQGYYRTITPSVILRTIFQNPGWYTQYTPYQAEIAQGRLEALLNFQTMVSELTGLPIANASLLDEGTAAAEAMTMFYDQKNKKAKDNPARKFFVDNKVFDQTYDVLLTRAKPLDIEVERGDWKTFDGSGEDYFGVLLQYPDGEGIVHDYEAFAGACKEKDIFVIAAADVLALTMIKAPGDWGADAAVGTTQRFGIPMGFGGPHAAYFATTEKYKRQIPGRIIGVSVDRHGNQAYRMALQTREQHIRREKATSNICTAQALLATMAGMYAVYHGPKGLEGIARRTHKLTVLVANALKAAGYDLVEGSYFDTLTVKADPAKIDEIRTAALAQEINLFYRDNSVSFSLDEACEKEDIEKLLAAFGTSMPNGEVDENLGDDVVRKNETLTHPIFSLHHSETKMMRYIRHLEEKDLSLLHSMIALGSCTMKLNAATQLIPVSWPEFSNVHPFVPQDQVEGYMEVLQELTNDLCEITGFTACSLQPNSGAQGEYTGLLTIKAYHEDRGDHHRNIALIPSSAHGTNPASAVMTGMKVVVVACDDMGNIDLDDLKAKAVEHKDHLAALMVTYPSTHGVFEEAIIEICDLIHDNGGLVYMDGANMNAQVGYTNPGMIHADVCHLNLHKTFAIPHGGGGPGMGPICVNDKLAPYLPGHVFYKTGGSKATNAVSAAPFGSASILLISHAYIKMLGSKGIKAATAYAILNANYIQARLKGHYDVLYTGKSGRVAHELILDLRPYKDVGVSAEDVAKRLIDYGFHAPTLSFPVAGTIMIEPTESESQEELDRFCDAMIAIKGEIDAIARGDMDPKANVLTNAPHTIGEVSANEWNWSYTREQAAYPLDYLRTNKFWAAVARVDNAYGDRNLVCTCPPMESYMED